MGLNVEKIFLEKKEVNHIKGVHSSDSLYLLKRNGLIYKEERRSLNSRLRKYLINTPFSSEYWWDGDIVTVFSTEYKCQFELHDDTISRSIKITINKDNEEYIAFWDINKPLVMISFFEHITEDLANDL